VLTEARQYDTYKIKTLHGLSLRDLLYSWYLHNLQSGVAWEFTGTSGSQAKSSISKMISLLLKEATVQEIAELNALRPSPEVDRNSWRLGIEMAAGSIVDRFQEALKESEIKYGIREPDGKDKRKMLVSAVKTRLAMIEKAKAKNSQNSVASYFGSNTSSTSSASSSSASSSSASNTKDSVKKKAGKEKKK
jgi:hypothetical protein